MKKLNSAVALAALAAVMSTPVYAADVEPMPAAADWTGFHVGLGGGGNFAFARDEASFYSSSAFTTAVAESFADLGKAGFFGTAEIGADYQMDNIVFGVLANYDFGKTKMKSHAEFVSSSSGTNYDTSVEVGDSWAAGGRIGWLPTESTLVYALGGYTQAKISQSAEISTFVIGSPATTVGEGSGSEWKSGYFVGAGVETLLTDSISLKGEYRFADYGKVSNSFFTSTPSSFGADQSSDVTVHSVRAVLSFRF